MTGRRNFFRGVKRSVWWRITRAESPVSLAFVLRSFDSTKCRLIIFLSDVGREGPYKDGSSVARFGEFT
jgi:hypothetical protein